jgi:hypothetical protein
MSFLQNTLKSGILPSTRCVVVVGLEGMNRGDRLQTDRRHVQRQSQRGRALIVDIWAF